MCAYGSVTQMAKPGWLRSSLLLAVLGLGVSVLVGCAEQLPPPPLETAAVPPPQQPAPQAPTHVERRPAHKPTPPRGTEGPETKSSAPDADNEALAMIAPEPARPGPSPAVTHPQVKELIGLDQPSATRLLGAASERTEEPPATIWRYKTPTCELNLFFYLDLRSGRMRTLHYTFKGDAADAARRQNCLSELAAARGT